MGAVDEAASSAAIKVTAGAGYGGAATAVVGSWSANDIAMIGGLIVGIVGMVGNLALVYWFKSQHLQIARARLEADIRERNSQGD